MIRIMARLIRFIFMSVLVFGVYKIIQHATRAWKRKKPQKPSDVSLVLQEDPVCGLFIPEKDAIILKNNKGEKFYFCSKKCSEKFLEERRLHSSIA